MSTYGIFSRKLWCRNLKAILILPSPFPVIHQKIRLPLQLLEMIELSGFGFKILNNMKFSDKQPFSPVVNISI